MNFFSSPQDRPTPEPSLERVIDALRASINNQKRIIELVTAQTSHITKGIEQQNDIIEQQNDTIRRQHESIAAFQNDLLLKSQKDLIMEIIGIADNIEATLKAQLAAPDYDTLLRDLRDLQKWVENSLLTACVRPFSDVAQKPREFNPRRQEQKEPVVTDDSERDGCYLSLQKGYVWTLPWLVVNSEVQLENVIRDNPEARQFQFVLRPETVALQRMASTTPEIDGLGEADHDTTDEATEIPSEPLSNNFTEAEPETTEIIQEEQPHSREIEITDGEASEDSPLRVTTTITMM